ncbi:TetR family transcriptional regulator [Microbacterium telephonicum]|uniref:TetR family transcriptional regulator n=1 Tax=Microbacterium telephonicum TaxID=1714841 RepID=A0A498C0A2_9MICO|nr:TetR family transcriptional regulator [Microbacterium telephonicum]RLK49354.1 TetR family transcriptional regulator [Microbacterium telephonicum]
MTTPPVRPGAGRPRASSRETLAEAASELFLERGFAATSVADITTRAGVSRSSFFNYFASKSDILWAGLDERIEALVVALDAAPVEGGDAAVAARIRDVVAGVGADFAPDPLALGIVHATAMGIVDELEREAAVRRARIARAVAAHARAAGADRIRADVVGAAWGGAVLAAIEAWAQEGAGRTALAPFLDRAADAVSTAIGGAAEGEVSQLRVVVQAAAFEQTLAFYRDVVGMPQAEAYEADGGARVAILAAGRATLEIANPAQVEFIDRVETDGDAPSDRIRLAFQVADADAAATRLAEAGADVEARPRVTPWNSRNARLRGPAGLQLTLFQELDPH